MREKRAPLPDPAAPAPQLSVAGFTALLDRAQWPLYTFLRGIVGDEEQARDLMQDTFYDAWRSAQRGAPPFDAGGAEDGVRRWLFHAAYNRAVSALRRGRRIRWQPLEDLDAGSLVAGGSLEDQIAEVEAVRAALASLSPADAACLLLIAVHSFTAAEVGQIVGASPQAVAKRFSRARKRLRDAYLAQNAQPPERLPL